jgi:hypothetical protein
VIKFKITPSRFAEACNIIEYMNVQAGILETIVRIAPRFILDEAGEYLVKVNLDADGDIESLENIPQALAIMAGASPKRLEKLRMEFMEAAKAIVGPPSGGGSNGPTVMDTKKPPPG